VRADAVVEAELRAGRTACTRLRSDPPITLRRTGEGVVHQIASSAGPIGGDDLRLRVRVGPGAALVLRSVAAAIVLPGPDGRPSRLVVEVDVEEGGALDLALVPQVLAHRCDHETTTTVRLAAGATLRLREVTVLGRHGEPGGSLLSRLRIDREQRALVRSDLAVGPRWPGSQGPAGVGTARCIGSDLVVGEAAPASGSAEARPEGAAVAAAAYEVGPGARMAQALGDDLPAVVAALDALGVARSAPV
jgi:urease accessory protein